MSVQQRAWGEWASPLSADELTRAGRSLAEPRITPDGSVWWLESRPDEGGRITLVSLAAGGEPVERVPAPYNVRTRVHEYGGGAWCPVGDSIAFSNFSDGALLRLEGDSITAIVQRPGWRFADLEAHPQGGWLAAVAESHTGTGEPENRLVAVQLDSGAVHTLASGADFYAAPRFAPDGGQLAFVSWDHPNMPWDATRLHLASVRGPETALDARIIADGAAISQPVWSPSGRTLFYVTDSSGWWNVVAWRDAKAHRFPADAAEYTVPHWVFGQRTLAPLDDVTLLAQRIDAARGTLVTLHADGGANPLDLEWQSFGGLQVQGNTAVFLAGHATRPGELVRMQLDSQQVEVLRTAGPPPLPVDCVSRAESLAFTSADGATAHAFFYPPHNPAFRGPDERPPPVIVMTHGGPTSMTGTSLNPRIQFYTSRGWAVLDVNYGGSTGYGSAYRRRLDGNWGIVDVADCVAAVEYMAAAGRVDPARVAIRGGSAGGYTTLASLAFTDTFGAGASHYGVGDLAALARDTHKFESRYLDRLVGPWPAAQAVYAERSALNACERIACPVIFFQGSEDAVVPPNQSESMAAALRARGVPVALVVFAGEGHGFRQPDNARQAIEQEYAFLSRAFGIRPADAFALPPIDNANALPELP